MKNPSSADRLKRVQKMKITEQQKQIQTTKRIYEKPALILLMSANTEGKVRTDPSEFTTFSYSFAPS
jgi:hypothetical protein